MKPFIKAAMAGVLTAAIAGSGLLGLAGAAFASGTAPAWEYDGNAAAPYGNITFYDANGDQVTSGSNLASPFAYAVAGTAADSGATKATLYYALPTHGELPALWNSTSEAGPTTFSPSVSGAPASINNFAPTFPVVNASSASITSWLTTVSPDPTSGYDNVIQVRLTDSGAGGHGNATGTYWESDIAYNNTSSAINVLGVNVPAGGWVQLFPFVNPSTTTLTTNATGGHVLQGNSITLTATSSTGGTGDGVNFFDNGTFLAYSTTPGTGGTYTYTYTPAAGAHSYTAILVPGTTPNPGDETGAYTTSAAIVGGSTSSAVAVSDTPPQTGTTTTLSASNNSPAYGASVTFTIGASAADSTNPAGTVELLDGTTPIAGCTSIAINPPAAPTCSTTALAQGANSITAVYTPTSNTYATSTSTAVVVTVAAPTVCPPGNAASVCSDAQNITVKINPGTITISTPYTSTNPFVLPPMTLSSDGTYLESQATFPAPPTGTAAPDTTISTPPTDTASTDLGSTGDTTVNVVSTSGFAPQGTATVATTNGGVPSTAEFTYTGLTGTSFTGVAYSAGSGTIAANAGVTGPANSQQIVVTSTLSPAYAWTLSVSATALTSGANSIPASGLGLTGGTLLNTTGPGAYPGTVNFTVGGIPAHNPSPVDTDTNSGLTSTPQTWAKSSATDGTAEMDGTLTLLAPTSTPAGTYSGTITFSVS